VRELRENLGLSLSKQRYYLFSVRLRGIGTERPRGAVGIRIVKFDVVELHCPLLSIRERYWKTARVTVTAYPYEGGSRIVIGGDDSSTIDELTRWLRSRPAELTRLSETDAASEAGLTQSVLGRPTLAEKLRELNELKEAGLITQEEYETKRAELLRRI